MAIIMPSLEQSTDLIELDKLNNDKKFKDIKGKGYSIVILDTGIDLDNKAFGEDKDKDGTSDRIVYSYDFANNDANANDRNGHGTNVAGIIASIASDANIIPLKVFKDNGEGKFSIVENALDWVIDNAKKYNIVAINMSLSDSLNHDENEGHYSVDDEFKQLTELGIINVAAMGNYYYQNQTQGSAYPAADPNVIGVGAVFDADMGLKKFGSGAIAYNASADEITPFSQRDKQMTDILAPGAAITAASNKGGESTYYGTSQATPHITATVALLQEIADKYLNKRLTQKEMVDILQKTGKDIVDSESQDDNVKNTGITFKRENIYDAAKYIYELGKGDNMKPAKVTVDINGKWVEKPTSEYGDKSTHYDVESPAPRQIHLHDSSYSAIDIGDYEITANTAFEIAFNTNSNKGIVGVGVDDDLLFTPNSDAFYQLAGNKKLGNQDYVAGTIGTKHWQSATISLADLAGKDIDYITLVNDGIKGSECKFRSIRLFEDDSLNDASIALPFDGLINQPFIV